MKRGGRGEKFILLSPVHHPLMFLSPLSVPITPKASKVWLAANTREPSYTSPRYKQSSVVVVIQLQTSMAITQLREFHC